MRKPKKVAPAKVEPRNIHASDVAAPDALDINKVMRNGDWLAAWWVKAQLYIDAMDALDRSVFLIPNGDGTGYILSSIPREVPHD